MKIKISLASLNGRGAIAEIETRDIFGGSVCVDIAGDENSTPKAVCLAAAESLRLAAVRFGVLANLSDPLNAKQQEYINDLSDDAL